MGTPGQPKPNKPSRLISPPEPSDATDPQDPPEPSSQLWRFSHNFTKVNLLLPKLRTVGSRVPGNIVIYWDTPPAYPVLRYIWMASYKNKCGNKLVSSIHTSFPYNTQPLPQSNGLLPRLDLDYPIVNRDDFFGCFQ